MGPPMVSLGVLLWWILIRLYYLFFQFKMKHQLHYGEDDCPISAPDGFPKEDELHFEIELIDFFKAKVRMSTLSFVFILMLMFCICYPSHVSKLK